MNVVDVKPTSKEWKAGKNTFTGCCLRGAGRGRVDTAGKDTVIRRRWMGILGHRNGGNPGTIMCTWCSKWTASRWVPRKKRSGRCRFYCQGPFSQRWCKFVMELSCNDSPLRYETYGTGSSGEDVLRGVNLTVSPEVLAVVDSGSGRYAVLLPKALCPTFIRGI